METGSINSITADNKNYKELKESLRIPTRVIIEINRLVISYRLLWERTYSK